MTDVDYLPQKCICRLCAKHELCTDIFSAVGMRELLLLKINTCLPIQVHKGDNLTKGVCPSCILKLNTAYELITTCVLVQSKLEEVNKRVVNGSSQEEVTSSVTKPLSPSAAESKGPIIVLPLTVDNVAEFNKLSAGDGKIVDEESSCTVPVISSVLTLASGPRIPKPVKHNAGINASDDEESMPKKKERKTVCFHCKQWFPRSKIQEHEKSHTTEINFLIKTKES